MTSFRKFLSFFFIASIFSGLLCMHISRTSAHVGGIPILKMNGAFVLPDIYESTNLYSDIRDNPPQRSYPVGSSIDFDINVEELEGFGDIWKKSLIAWDFGDGVKVGGGQGTLHQSHTYTKEGRYNFLITIDTTPAGFPAAPEIVQFVPIVVGNPPEVVTERSSSFIYGFEPYATSTDGMRRGPSLIGYVVLGVIAVLIIGYTVRKKHRGDSSALE